VESVCQGGCAHGNHARKRGALTPEEKRRALELDPVSGPEVEAGLQEKEEIIRDRKHVAFVRAGAQTGADRGGLDAARDVGVPICGWVPKGGRAEDAGRAPGLLRLYPELVETPSDWYMQRTAWNVRDSHCTLIVCAGGIEAGSGTEATVEFARDYGRPWMVAEGPADADHVWEWLVGIGQGLTVNIAGPRASKDPDVYGLAYDLLTLILLRDRS
jgi:hypothetical protein